MVWITLLQEAFSALWANRLRSILTVIGMIMGVTSVIAIVSTVEGMQQNLENGLNAMGPKSFIVTRIGITMSAADYLERLKRKKFTRGMIPFIEEGCPDCDEVGAESYAREHIRYGKTKMRRVSIDGFTPNMLSINSREMEMGRYLSWEDDRRRKQVAVIGYKIYEKLFVNEDPIGKKIKIGRREFSVVGVIQSMGESDIINGIDDFVGIPLSTHQKLYPKPGRPVNLVISADSLAVRERAMDQVRVVARSMRKLAYEDDDDFTILTPDGVLSFVNDITRGFRIVFISLPVLSIVVGGIVIMNIMMISVTERTREIGIRKSIGANRGNILIQFLYEAVILSLVGGLLGVGLGIYMGGVLLEAMFDILVTPTSLAIFLGFGISTGVGLFFGIYPAMKAARLDPIKALSYE